MIIIKKLLNISTNRIHIVDWLTRLLICTNWMVSMSSFIRINLFAHANIEVFLAFFHLRPGGALRRIKRARHMLGARCALLLPSHLLLFLLLYLLSQRRPVDVLPTLLWLTAPRELVPLHIEILVHLTHPYEIVGHYAFP